MKTIKPILLIAFLLLFIINIAEGATRTASSNGNWNSTSTWGNNPVPTSADDVIINNDRNVTVNVAAQCASLTINGGNRQSSIEISGTNSLTVTGTITIGAPTNTNNSRNKFILVDAGTLTAASIAIENSNNDNRDSYISISTGTANISGNIAMSGTADRNQIVFTGAGILNVGGTISGGTISNEIRTFTAPTRGTVNYNGANLKRLAPHFSLNKKIFYRTTVIFRQINLFYSSIICAFANKILQATT